MVSSADARLTAARSALARALLDALPNPVLGSVMLRDDQRGIIARARRALRLCGGCLIAEDVGRGKTFVGLSIAGQWRGPLVVVPAALRTTWRVAMDRAGVQCTLVSHESLSRGVVPVGTFDGIVVDESHHFRTAATRRYAALSALSARLPLVLLSATPLQNRVRDLQSQMALFLGEAAFQLDAHGLACFVIRSFSTEVATMPKVALPVYVNVAADDSRVLDAILDLTPPARPLDSGDAGVLRTLGLVRAWASSRAALAARLRARRRVAVAIEQCAEEGRMPTRKEARAWSGIDESIQLGFPSFLASGAAQHISVAIVRLQLDEERRSTFALMSALADTADPDRARVDALRALRRQFSHERIIAFSEFASTVHAFFSALRSDPGVGLLTSRDTRIASGRIARDDMLARFAPVAQGVIPMPQRDRVTLLLATDLLSEGVNLQDASIVVHLDLPWNPARLAQRVGRVRRPGGADVVRTFLISPPADAAALLQAETRLRRKISDAELVIGAGFAVLPTSRDTVSSACGVPKAFGSATDEGELYAILERVRERDETSHGSGPRDDGVNGAAVESADSGWLVALSDGRLVGCMERYPPDTSQSVLTLTRQLGGIARHARTTEVDAMLTLLARWLFEGDIARTCGLADPARGPIRHALERRLADVAQSVLRHQRSELLPVVSQLRSALQRPLPIGLEQSLSRLADERGQTARDWLYAMHRALPVSRVDLGGGDVRPPRPVAYVVFGPCVPPETCAQES